MKSNCTFPHCACTGACRTPNKAGNGNIMPTHVHPRQYAAKAWRSVADAENQLLMMIANMETAGCRPGDVDIIRTAHRYSRQARDLLRSRM
jgi:hypothetical protein